MQHIKLAFILSALFGLHACSSVMLAEHKEDGKQFYVKSANGTDQRDVELMLARDAALRRLERRIDDIRTGRIKLDPSTVQLREQYGVVEPKKLPVSPTILEYNEATGLVDEVAVPSRFRWEVAYEFPDQPTANYFWLALSRLNINSKQIDGTNPYRIIMGTYPNSRDAAKRKEALHYILDLDWAVIRKIPFAYYP